VASRAAWQAAADPGEVASRAAWLAAEPGE